MAQREIPFRPRAGTCGSHSTTQKQQLSSSPTMTLMGGPSVSSITGSIGSTDHSFIEQRHGGEATTITSITAPFELPEDLQLHIEDTFALAHQLRLFNGALKGQLDFIVFSADESEMAPDYIQDAIVLWQTTLASLNTQGLLGYESAELYINSRNFMNYTETVPTLNFAEAELESFLGAIASFERCIMDDERKMWRELAHTLASSSDEGNRSAKVLNLRLKLGASRLVRAEARRDLEVVVADLCTPSLAAFQYLPNPRTEQEHTANAVHIFTTSSGRTERPLSPKRLHYLLRPFRPSECGSQRVCPLRRRYSL